jgi:ribonucleotide monophosphatase NagD (HAD superfamily)
MDRCNTDIAFGHAAGWSTLLVLTGCHSLEYARTAPANERPDYVTQSAADLAAYL